MSTAIVQLNISQTSAPAPQNQQQLGALISQGATTLAADAKQLLTGRGDLASILQPAKAITTLTWDTNVVTATTTAPHGIPTGDTVTVTIAGATPSGYNGTYQATSTGASTFTYPLASNPGAETVPGTYILGAVAELTAMNKTFWDQGAQAPIYVLELGPGDAAAGVAALNAYITANIVNDLGPFYSYLVPTSWADEATFLTFLASFEALDAKTYFWITADGDNYDSFTTLMKCANVMIPAPAAPAAEFSHASDFQAAIAIRPSATNKVTPFRFKNLFGVTAYPQPGNNTLIETILDSFTNLILTGAEGGLSNTILRNGTFKDGRDQNYWYAVDWTLLTVDRDVSAAIINGSNNPQNPLYYNQDGINRLQAVIAATMARGVNFGMVFGAPIQVQMEPADFVTAVNNGDFAGQTPINAQPFISYSAAHPSDFANGIYSGFQIAMTPNRGFAQIIIGLNVTDFVAGT